MKVIFIWSCFFSYIFNIQCNNVRRDKSLSDEFVVDIQMPNAKPFYKNQYMCTALKLDLDEAYIVNFEPHAKVSRAHHMILFGSSGPLKQLFPGYWDCANENFKGSKILFAWAKNAPAVTLPKDIGFEVGEKSDIHYLILQVHYLNPLTESEGDNSGLRLKVKQQRPKYMAGIFVLANSLAIIPPAKTKFHVDVSCNPPIQQPIYLFAFRVHTHELGYVVSGYKFNTRNTSWELIAKGNPKWPQAIFPTDAVYKITEDDILVARCTYDSTSRSENTYMGRGAKDEMCNLYLMYYSVQPKENSHQNMNGQSCGQNHFPRLAMQLPEGNDVSLPSNPGLEEMAASDESPPKNTRIEFQDINVSKKGDMEMMESDYDEAVKGPVYDENYQYQEIVDWPSGNLSLGQVTAVTVDSEGNVVLFHRGSHVWGGLSFNVYDHYLQTEEGPITEYTVIVLDPKTGRIVRKWGSNIFYLPHGLSIDSKGYAWLTDVALHQVFKFPEKGAETADLILGERFMPGTDNFHFCKPTSVAVASNGDFYVADGYCNSRIMQFSAEGKYLSQWGKSNPIFRGPPSPPPPGAFLIPHKIIMAEGEDLICVADRENGRAQCFTRVDQKFAFAIQREEFHGRLFSISATRGKGGLLYAICGSSVTGLTHPVEAFIFNLTTKSLLNKIVPRQGTFSQPHDLAISADTESIYVAEIGPNKIWKFDKVIHKSSKKVLPTGLTPTQMEQQKPDQSTKAPFETSHPPMPPPPPPQPHVGPAAQSPATILSEGESSGAKKNTSTGVVTEASNFAISMVIMALLGIPILLLVLITVIVRLRKRGRFQQCSLPQVKGWLGGYRTPHGSHEKFNIGSLLNPHKGFDRVALDESDLEVEDKSDSDVEEFNAAATRKA